MRPSDQARQALARLFQRHKIAELDQLFTALRTRSRMTLFPRLSTMGCLTSYSHDGLREGPTHQLRPRPVPGARGRRRARGAAGRERPPEACRP